MWQYGGALKCVEVNNMTKDEDSQFKKLEEHIKKAAQEERGRLLRETTLAELLRTAALKDITDILKHHKKRIDRLETTVGAILQALETETAMMKKAVKRLDELAELKETVEGEHKKTCVRCIHRW